ncbi:hypothetical protein ACFU6I_32510 [Streptomyces sp. NPDC057486]|uniref:hypothetical protein n=1 Tax=Streptomyces sp. NPDC057486 TaxID=3346145 RepID=UPI003696E94F
MWNIEEFRHGRTLYGFTKVQLNHRKVREFLVNAFVTHCIPSVVVHEVVALVRDAAAGTLSVARRARQLRDWTIN